MAQELRIQGRFGFHSIQLVKSDEHSLGIGSYGAVYRAKCDQLVCAAKILHPILFQTRDPGAYRIVERFQREIEFLSGLKHPNIIQYLGSCADPESGLPVLFMELMDENLTSFLERPGDPPPPLPLYVQVDIAHDVVQALSHLHQHEVVHRDLSSNNVLLIGSRRAKVTDFGMAKLLRDDPRLTPTYCPGTNGYMSPEALSEPPSYTSKLDIFSCGVLFVQLITRKFPNPSPRTNTIQLNDPRVPSGRVLVEVPELERRREHLDLISPTHPLLRIALDCLKDKESQRPTANQLCSRLIALKSSHSYQNSLREIPQGTTLRPTHAAITQQLTASESRARSRVRNLTREVDQLQKLVQRKDKEIQENKKDVMKLEQQLMRSREESTRGACNFGPSAPFETCGHSVAVSGEIVYCCDSVSGSRVLMFNSNTGQWSVLPSCPKTLFSIAIVNGILTAVGGHLDEVSNSLLSLAPETHEEGGTLQQTWIEHFPPMKYGHSNPAVVTTEMSLIVAGGSGYEVGTEAAVELMNTQTLQWSLVPSLPYPLSQATAVVCRGSLYIGGGFVIGGATKSVLTAKLSDLLQPELGFSPYRRDYQDVWKQVASLPVVQSSLVTYKGYLLAVGGEATNGNTTDVKQYDASKNSWNSISHMKVKRSSCLAAVISDNTLFVCGGITPKGHTALVEMGTLYFL